MQCDDVRQCLLELDADDAGRRCVAGAMAHLDTCAECQAALVDFDQIRLAFAAAGKEPSLPHGAWEAAQGRLFDAISRTPRRRGIRGLAIAASLLVGVLIFELGRHAARSGPQVAQDMRNVPPASELAPAPFAPREMSHELAAFHQVSQVFDGRAGWMMTSQDDSAVGVGSDRLSGEQKVLLLRLVLTRGGAVISDADLLVVAGEKADLTIPLRQGQALHYRIGTSADEPTRLTLTLELDKPHGGELLAAMTTALRMEPGERLTAGRLATSAGEYQLSLSFTRTTLEAEAPGNVIPRDPGANP